MDTRTNLIKRHIHSTSHEPHEHCCYVSQTGTIIEKSPLFTSIFRKDIANIKELEYCCSYREYILLDTESLLEINPIQDIFQATTNSTFEIVVQTEIHALQFFLVHLIILKDQDEPFYFLTFKDISLSIQNQALTQEVKKLKKENLTLSQQIDNLEEIRLLAQSSAIKEKIINKISLAILDSVDLNFIIETAILEIGQALNASNCFLGRMQFLSENIQITNVYQKNNNNHLKNQTIHVVESPLLTSIVHNKKPFIGVSQAIFYNEFPEQPQAFIAWPIINDDKIFGILFLEREDCGMQWHDVEIDLIRSIIYQLSISIKNAHLFKSLSDQNIKISVLHEIVKAINSSIILDNVFQIIGKETRRLIKFDFAGIAVLDDTTNQLCLYAKIDQTGLTEVFHKKPIIITSSVILSALETLSPTILSEREANLLSRTPEILITEVNSAIIVPLINRGNVTGVFYAVSSNINEYNEFDTEIIEQITGQLAVSIDNANLYFKSEAHASKETLVNHILSSIRKSMSIHEIIKTAAHELGKILDVSVCYIQHFVNSTEEIIFYQYTKQETYKENIYIISEKDKALFQLYLKENDITLLNVNTTYNPDLIHLMERNHFESSLLYPLIYKETMNQQESIVGLIALHQADEEKLWTQEEISIVKMVADQLAVAIIQANLFEETAQQKEQLKQAIHSLQETQAQLVQSEKMASLGQLVAGIAHEINTPIGAINNNTSIMEKSLNKLEAFYPQDSINDAETIKLLSLVQEMNALNKIACERIKDVVYSLKNFARLDESELKFVDITEGIKSTLTLVKTHLKQKNILVLEKYQSLPHIQCYPSLMNQVFMNIIVNAYQSMPEGGTITISAAVINANSISIEICDTGIGIDQETLSKIFDPGFTTKGVGIGTGLGLAIVYQIIEKHHGHIEVTSEINKGTTFTISLPIQTE